MSHLRPPPAALRPTLTEFDTVIDAVTANKDAILSWAFANGHSHGETEESIIDLVTTAISQAEGDAPRAARLMELTCRWKVDERIIWHFTVVKKNLPSVLNLRIMRWVLATGVRFPGKVDDLVVFVSSDQFQRTGRVVKLLNQYAQALVLGESGGKGIINAEAVVANKTDSALMPRALPLHDQRLPLIAARPNPSTA